MRVIFDSNVWIAVVAHRGVCRQVWRSARGNSRFVTSNFICSEILEILSRKFRFAPNDARRMTEFVKRQCEIADDSAPILSSCRDPDDLRVLASAVAGKCEFLVTGDSDLLTIREHGIVKIVGVQEFRALVGAKST